MNSVEITILVVLWLLALGSFVIAAYHFAMTIDNAKPEMKVLIYFVGPFSMLSSFLTEEGLYHRRRLGVFLFLAIVSGGLFAVFRMAV
jgi:hypothetical protein